MGCIEHSCTNPLCNWLDVDNDSGRPDCPLCGGRTVVHFDEEAEYRGRHFHSWLEAMDERFSPEEDEDSPEEDEE